jgi:hypothetical protein
MISRLLAIIAGCAVGMLLTGGTFLIAGMIPPWLAGILGAAGLTGMIVCWRRIGSVFVWSCALAVFALSAALPWPASSLVRDAERIAGGAPYCIQVAKGGDYRQAGSWLDFSPAVMSAMVKRGHAMQFHAVLAVGSGPEPTLYNWSYRSMSWRSGTRSHALPVVSCVPRHSFAAELPYLVEGPTDPDTVFLRLTGRSFTIPASYQPRAHAADNPYLMLTVDVADARPAACDGPRACVNHWLQIYLRPVSVMSWLDGPVTESARVVDDSATPNERIRTRIDCYPASYNGGFNCTQHFLFDGVLFRFQMREADLDDWRVIQSRLVALFRDLQAPR